MSFVVPFFFIGIFTIFDLKFFKIITLKHTIKLKFLWHRKNKRRSALAELSFKCWEESGPEPGLDIVWA